MSLKNNKEYTKGAVKLISSLNLKAEGNLIILSDEQNADFSKYFLEVIKIKKIRNVIFIVLTDILRPITEIPEPLKGAVEKAKGLIHTVNRLPEENFVFNRALQELCISNECKYIYIYDPKLCYLKEGIAADYKTVSDKTNRIKKILEHSKEIKLTSKTGSNLSFSLYTNNMVSRSPLFKQGHYWNQAPEGELMTCPIEKSFNGKLVVDGVVTGMGLPKKPTVWTFKNGVVVDVKGDKDFLSKLLQFLRKSDKKVSSLVGIWIAEFSIGANDWAVFDDNISNCEKVSGGVHFAMGNSEGLGINRGEKYHFDNIVTAPSIVVASKSGEKRILIKSGELII